MLGRGLDQLDLEAVDDGQAHLDQPCWITPCTGIDDRQAGQKCLVQLREIRLMQCIDLRGRPLADM